MGVRLFVAIKVQRENFFREDYLEKEDVFALVKEGAFRIRSAGREYVVRAGEGMLFRANCRYFRKIVEPTTMYLFRYQSDEPLFAEEHARFIDTARIRSTIEMLESLEEKRHKDDFKYRCHLFADIAHQYALEHDGERGVSAEKKDELIEGILLYVNNHIQRSLSVSELASRAGLSYVQFLRRFQAYTKMLPTEYLAMLRVQRAKYMLTNTDMLIKEVAIRCGFDDEYYFSNFFKKQTGESPTAFRTITR